MLNAMVILLFLFNCVDGDVNVANALLPLAAAHVSSSLHIANSSQLMQRITADPKAFVSELASADPTVILTVIGMLEEVIANGNIAEASFERNVNEAKIDKDAKTIAHDDLVAIVTGLTTSITQETEDKIVAVRNAGVAGEAKQAAIEHHTETIEVRDANVPGLESDKATLVNIVALLEGLDGINSSPGEWERFDGICVSSDGTNSGFHSSNHGNGNDDLAKCKEGCVANPTCSGIQFFADQFCSLMLGEVKAIKGLADAPGDPELQDIYDRHKCYIKPQ